MTVSNTPMTDTVAVPREPAEGHDAAVLATDLALLNDLIYTHGGDAALAGWVRIVRSLSAAPKPQQASQQGEGAAKLNHLTASLIDRFAVAMKEKAAAAERKYGYSDGWLATDWCDDLQHKLAEHVQKGDPRDVAIYSAFAWHHGWRTASYAALSPQPAPVGEAVAWRVQTSDGLGSFIVTDPKTYANCHKGWRENGWTIDALGVLTTPAGQSTEGLSAVDLCDRIPATDDLHRHAVEIYGTARNLGPDNLASFARNCIEQFVEALSTQPSSPGET